MCSLNSENKESVFYHISLIEYNIYPKDVVKQRLDKIKTLDNNENWIGDLRIRVLSIHSYLLFYYYLGRQV